MASDLSKTKEIKYNGGVVTFNIPSDWVEDFNEKDGGTYYEDLPSSGTFRIHLLTMQSPAPVKKSQVAEVLAGVASQDAKIVNLPNGNAYKYYVSRTKESDENITIYYWSLAQIVEPSHARIANFSYTILTNQEGSNRITSELAFLTKQIEQASFYPELASGI